MKIKLLTKDATIPVRSTNNAAGYDLFSAEDVTIDPGNTAKVNTDIAIALPENTYGKICERSGLALKGIRVGGGVIDYDYRGNIGIIITNHGKEPFSINKGNRIAQLVIHVIQTPNLELVYDLDTTIRLDKGFGSTGY